MSFPLQKCGLFQTVQASFQAAISPLVLCCATCVWPSSLQSWSLRGLGGSGVIKSCVLGLAQRSGQLCVYSAKPFSCQSFSTLWVELFIAQKNWARGGARSSHQVSLGLLLQLLNLKLNLDSLLHLQKGKRRECNTGVLGTDKKKDLEHKYILK